MKIRATIPAPLAQPLEVRVQSHRPPINLMESSGDNAHMESVMKKILISVAVLSAVSLSPLQAMSADDGTVIDWKTVEGRWQNWMRELAAEGHAQLQKNPADKLLAENDKFGCVDTDNPNNPPGSKNVCRSVSIAYVGRDRLPMMGIDVSLYDDTEKNKLMTITRTVCDLLKAECWTFETNKRWKVKPGQIKNI